MAESKNKKKQKENDSKRAGKIRTLRGIPDIRRYFYMNEEPIYFISATNFNLLGADEWIKGFKFITYIECFDREHPNAFTPKQDEKPEFESIEQINNYLLEHKEVVDYIQKRGKKSKAMELRIFYIPFLKNPALFKEPRCTLG